MADKTVAADEPTEVEGVEIIGSRDQSVVNDAIIRLAPMVLVYPFLL